MRENVEKLLNYIQRHLAGTGIAAVITVMTVAVVLGVSGQRFGFDPGDISESYSAGYSESPDGTGYDLSENGAESEDVNKDSDREKENDGNPELEEKESMQDRGNERVVLPEGMTGNTKPSGTVSAAVDPDMSGPGFGGNVSVPGEGNHPGTNRPGGGSSQEGEKPPEKKFVIYVNGQEIEFDSEDDALVWVADHAGKNDNGQYFEGTFIKDKDGNLIPGYTDKDKFEEGVNGDISYDYTGDSEVFVVPGGTKSLELGRGQPAETRKKIKTIVIPQTVTDIGMGLGSNGFTSLEKFIVSGDNPNFFSLDGVLYRRMEAGKAELYLMPAAKKTVLEWPDGLAVIGENSFADSRMDRVEFPDTVTAVEDYAFMDSYVGTIVIPESVRSIGSVAFGYADTSVMHRIIVKASTPPAVTGSTFLYMSENSPVTAEILVPDSEGDRIYEAYLAAWGRILVNRYGKAASLQLLKTSGGAQTRYEYAEESSGRKGYRKAGEAEFVCWWDALGVYRKNEKGNTVLVECTASSEVVSLVDSGIEFIDEGAFENCTLLTAVRLPESLKEMPEDCFLHNKNLKVIISYAPAPPALHLGVSASCSVFVKPGSLSDYQSAWKDQVRKILGISETYSVTKSGLVLDSAGSSRLLDIPADMSSLTLPSYVTSIYDRAMADNMVLKSISIPSRIISIGEGAFADCVGLTAVSWQTSAGVPESCFEGCINLKSFSASGTGHNLKSIGDRAFYGCSSLGTVLYYNYTSGNTNPAYYGYLASVGNEAFYGCISMTYAYLHPSVTNVGVRAFEGSGLTQMYWYTSAEVSDNCFKNCRALGSLGWWNGAYPSTLGSGAFYGCVSLKSFSVPSAVTAIGNQAFDGREGNALTLTFEGTAPPAWSGQESVTGLIIYVPDSDGDTVYQAYLNTWKGWLGTTPGNVLKTTGGAESHAASEDPLSEEPSDKGVQEKILEEPSGEGVQEEMSEKPSGKEISAEKGEKIDHDY